MTPKLTQTRKDRMKRAMERGRKRAEDRRRTVVVSLDDAVSPGPEASQGHHAHEDRSPRKRP